MGCGCSGGAKAALKGVQKYKVEGTDTEYLTEREALAAKETLGLSGDVVPVQ